MLRFVAAAVTAALLIVAGPAPAHADRPYFQRQCDTGVITWSVKGGRYGTAYKAIRWVDRRMDAYRFQQVPVYWDANIAIDGILSSGTLESGDAQTVKTMYQLLGEAYTLRAYWYSMLVYYFGDVPNVREAPKAGNDFFLPKEGKP